MKQTLLKTCVPLSAMVLLAGCVDDNYDLSDIDKTTQVNVKDLVVPVNLDAIELSNIIEIDDDSQIKIVNLDGKEVYAVSQTGEFNSDPIDVASFTAAQPSIEKAYATFIIDLPAQAKTRAAQTLSYHLQSSDPQNVEISASGVDESIKEITALEFNPMKIEMSLSAAGLAQTTDIKLKSIEIQFLKGLTMVNLPSSYHYNPSSGILTVDNLDCPGNSNHKGTITVTATALDFTKADATLRNQEFSFDSEVKLRDAHMDLVVNDQNQLPGNDPIEFEINTTVSELHATYFSGVLEYRLEGDQLNIDPVSLSDIPDFLANDETNLRLANPQIYLNLNNPMAIYGLNFQTGLELASVRPEGRRPFELDNGELIRVTDAYGVDGPYNFVVSPSLPSEILPGYAKNIQHVQFSSLSDILAGSGLPQSIEINLLDPELPRQTVNRFQLDNSIPGVKGTYDFFAPLALKTGENGSVIVYSDSDDGWSDEDLDKLTINTLQITADAYSTLPIGAELTLYPLDKNGNVMTGVKVDHANIKANANGEQIVLTLSGEIKGLDGVKYEAVVRPGSEEALSPSQTLTLKNIKAKVSGFYLTDFG